MPQQSPPGCRCAVDRFDADAPFLCCMFSFSFLDKGDTDTDKGLVVPDSCQHLQRHFRMQMGQRQGPAETHSHLPGAREAHLNPKIFLFCVESEGNGQFFLCCPAVGMTLARVACHPAPSQALPLTVAGTQEIWLWAFSVTMAISFGSLFVSILYALALQLAMSQSG